MHRWIASVAVISLMFFMPAGSSIDSLILHDSAGQIFANDCGAVNLQEKPSPTLKPGSRCRPERAAQCARAGVANIPPEVELKASEQKITLPCKEGEASQSCTPSNSQQVQLTASASDADGDSLRHEYSTTGGRIKGEGADVAWDLTGVQPGTYTATVVVDDTCGCVAFSATRVTVAACSDCRTNSK